MIKIFVVTDDFDKWIEKFKNEIENSIRLNRSRVELRNELFSIIIVRSLNSNLRGAICDVLLLDRELREEEKIGLMGHRNSVIYMGV